MAEFYLRPPPGAEALTKFVEACAKALPQARFESLDVTTNISEPNAHLHIGGGQPGAWAQQAAALEKTLRECAFCYCTRIRAVAGRNSQTVIEYVLENNKLAAKVVFSGVEGMATKADPIALADSLNREFAFCRPEEIFIGALPEAQQQQLRAYERAISDLTTQAAEMHRMAGELELQQAEHFRKRQEEMDGELAARRRGLQEEHDRAMAEVKERESAHQRKVEDFELREGTAVRRDLAKKLREEIAKSPAVEISRSARRPRWTVHGVCLVVLVLSAALAAGAYRAFLAGALPATTAYPALAGAMVIFGSTLCFYLRFNYIWADRMAQAELTARKYASDFKRADWLTELICEYAADGKREFPPEVAARLAHGLFADVRWGRQNLHPGEDIVEFASRMKKLKVARDGVEVGLGGDGAP